MTEYLRYGPGIETPEPDEAETGRALIETMRAISETTLADGGHALRSVHAKSHGLVEGELEVLPGLAPELAQGLFARAGCYPVVMRFSTNPGDILDDDVSVPRGLALKVIGVEGERLPGSDGDRTQDFVMVNGPAFAAASAKDFLKTLKLLAATTDRAEGLKKAASAVLRGVQHVVVAATGSPSPTIAALGGQPATHILGESFYSQAPLRFGDHVAKVGVAPVSPGLTALTDAPIALAGHPNALREAVAEHFRAQGGTWELRVQLCTDLRRMPVEDSSVVWSEDESPFRAVARITAPPQSTWSEARAGAVDDRMLFSPWHGLMAHRPLGSIMRVRKAVYEAGRQFRAAHNDAVVAEPRERPSLPG